MDDSVALNEHYVLHVNGVSRDVHDAWIGESAVPELRFVQPGLAVVTRVWTPAELRSATGADALMLHGRRDAATLECSAVLTRGGAELVGSMRQIDGHPRLTQFSFSTAAPPRGIAGASRVDGFRSTYPVGSSAISS